jgi:glycerophosphoryl diester phosphodiesterase
MKIFAHRGASGEFPENTLLAFEQAIVQGADGIELDVQYHHSGQLILLHDASLNTTTNGQGNFNDLSLNQLQQLDAGSGQQIPTLQQALELINGRCKVNIEVKLSNSAAAQITELLTTLQRQLAYAIEQYNFNWSQFIISSFNHPLVAAITMPKVATAALIACLPLSLSKFATALNTGGVNPSINCLDLALVQDAHQRGLKVCVYTVDTEEDLALCSNMNVDAIFTNYPARSRSILQKLQRQQSC